MVADPDPSGTGRGKVPLHTTEQEFAEVNAPSHAWTQLLPAILCNYVCTHRPPTACIYPLATCACVDIHTHIYKISWDDGHGMRDASGSIRGWILGTRDKSGAGSRESLV